MKSKHASRATSVGVDFLRFAICWLALASLVSCSGQSARHEATSTETSTLSVASAVPQSIVVQPCTTSIPVGVQLRFNAVALFKNRVKRESRANVTWSVSDTRMASINSTGLLTALASGQVTVTALHVASGVSGSTTLTVDTATLNGLIVTPGRRRINIGVPARFRATGTYSDGTRFPQTNNVVWTTSNPAVATIDASGRVAGVSVGTVAVSAAEGGTSAKAVLLVGNAKLKSIAIGPAAATLPVGTTQAFLATGQYSDGTTGDVTDAATWSSAQPTVATISNGAEDSGLATAVAAGATTVSAQIGARSATSSITVIPVTLTAIVVGPPLANFPSGTSRPFQATGIYSDHSTRDLTTLVAWASSSGVVTISNSDGFAGVATAVMPGVATITATDPTTGTSGTATATATPAALVSISLAPGNASIAVGISQSYAATGTFSDGGHGDVTSQIIWSVGDDTIAAISNDPGTEGLVTSLAVGTTTVTATVPATGVSSTVPLSVTAAVLVSLAISPATATLPAGEVQTFTALGTYSDLSVHTVAVAWPVWGDRDGPTVVFGFNIPGTYTVAAQERISGGHTNPNISATATIVVTPAIVTAIVVTPVTQMTTIGDSRPFGALGTFTDGLERDLTNSVTWESSNTQVAAIAATTGIATALSGGTATMTATDPATGVSGSATFSSTTGLPVATVPWVSGNPTVPHLVMNGTPTTLKGITGPGATQYRWTFGDGTSTEWLSITDPSNLGVAHTYRGLTGQPFLATLVVAGPSNVSLAATYPIQIADPAAKPDPRIAIAEDEALWYLHTHLQHGAFSAGAPGYGLPYAYGAGIAESCADAEAFERSGASPSGDPLIDPYAGDVNHLLNYVFASMTPVSPTMVSFPIPDGSFEDDDAYAWGTCSQAIALGLRSSDVVPAGWSTVYGSTVGALSQSLANYVIYQQGFPEGPDQGGWYLDAHSTLFATLALSNYEKLGASLPASVRTGIAQWLATTKSTVDGGWAVESSQEPSDVTSTAAALFESQFVGQSSNSTSGPALSYLGTHWNYGTDCSLIGGGSSMTDYAVQLALRASAITTLYAADIGGNETEPFDWFYANSAGTLGVNPALVQSQKSDGSWLDSSEQTTCANDSAGEATALNLSTLEGSSASLPVASICNCSIGAYGVNASVLFDGSCSYPLAVTTPIVDYQWDYSYDGRTFVQSLDNNGLPAAGPSVTKPDGFPQYTEDTSGFALLSAPIYAVALQVTDARGAQAISVCNVTVKPPPHCPVPSAGGGATRTYYGSVGNPIKLDATASFNSDASPMTYAWSYTRAGVFTDSTLATPTTAYPTPGTYSVAVQVTTYPAPTDQGVEPQCTVTAYSTVVVSP
ncbi:MAG: Ig-like domain-containing protein [Polyangiaceae bacterium]